MSAGCCYESIHRARLPGSDQAGHGPIGLRRHIVEALEHGPQTGPALPAFGDVASPADEGYQQTENGYGVLRDGAIAVSARTDMPGVTGDVWSWWSDWHSSDSRCYKLWHQRALSSPNGKTATTPAAGGLGATLGAAR